MRLSRRAATTPVALQALHCDVLEAVATGVPLAQIARRLCLDVEQLVPDVVCSVLLVDDEGRLRPLAAPGLPDAFSAAIDGLPIGPEVGSCGAAAYHGHPIEAREIDADPRWAAYKTLPIAAGMRACWSSPIAGHDGRIVGTFAFYYRTCRGSTAFERRIVDTSVHICALAIEHATVWARLELTNQRFDLALSYMSQGLCFFDGESKLIVANRRYGEIYGLPPGRVGPGTSLREIVALRVAAGSGPTTTPAQYIDWRDSVREIDAPNDTVVELANGRFIAIHHHPMPDSGWVATHEDITERRRAEAQIAHMARHDSLTGLPNRVLFHERLAHGLMLAGQGRPCAVLSLDLDQFKAVNDTFGHAVGDRLLQAVALRLRDCVREADTPTRLGGDEFAVLMADVDRPERAAEMAQRIVRRISEPFDLDGQSLSIGASVGIALAAEGDTSDTLLKSADTALYRAKADERGTYRFFEPAMEARQRARLALQQDLRQAVRDQVFQVAYQPVITVADNAISGFEALLRWPHAARGMVPPNDFIPLAEETGLIVTLGEWILHQACAEALRWPDAVGIAVNLSAVQFRTTGLLNTVAAALNSSGLPAARLELEITESVLLHNTADILDTLHALRGLGVRIALDDFGTGYSSLSYLRSFPFDKIKIDQSFIAGLSEREDSLAIIRAVVSLGKSLGMRVTAEGVETMEQLEQLRRAGCTEVQGYLFGRPMPAADAKTMIDRPAIVAVCQRLPGR